MDSELLWGRARNGDQEARARLIEEQRPLVDGVVQRMHLPATAMTDRDDLVSAGTVGLIDAIDRYEPGRGVPFEAYAAQRIRGAVYDELRRLDSRGKWARRKARDIQAVVDALVLANGRTPTLEELTAATSIDPEQARTALYPYSYISLSLERLLTEGEDGASLSGDPASSGAERDILDEVRAALNNLPRRERHLLTQYYGASLTLREIGRRMGVSEARACQLHARALSHVRQLIFRKPASGSRFAVA